MRESKPPFVSLIKRVRSELSRLYLLMYTDLLTQTAPPPQSTRIYHAVTVRWAADRHGSTAGVSIIQPVGVRRVLRLCRVSPAADPDVRESGATRPDGRPGSLARSGATIHWPGT